MSETERREQLKRANEEDKAKVRSFADSLDEFVRNGMSGGNPFTVLKDTPAILQKYGCEDKVITIDPRTVRKILSDDAGKVRNAHAIPLECLKDLPNQLRNPLAIMRGKSGKMVILTEFKVNDEPVIAAIELNRVTGNNSSVNSVRSVYGKNKDRISEWLNDDSITVYIDENRREQLASRGLQSTKGVNPAPHGVQQSGQGRAQTNQQKPPSAVSGNPDSSNIPQPSPSVKRKLLDTFEWNGAGNGREESYSGDTEKFIRQQVKAAIEKKDVDALYYMLKSKDRYMNARFAVQYARDCFNEMEGENGISFPRAHWTSWKYEESDLKGALKKWADKKKAESKKTKKSCAERINELKKAVFAVTGETA